MGDTGLFGDMKLIGDYYKPDLLLVPIGGHYVHGPEGRRLRHQGLIKPKMAWPMHYASNPFLKGTPAEYKAALGQTSIQMIDAEAGRPRRRSRRSLLQDDFPDRLRQVVSVDRPLLDAERSPARGEQAVDGRAIEEALGLAIDQIIVRPRSADDRSRRNDGRWSS